MLIVTEGSLYTSLFHVKQPSMYVFVLKYKYAVNLSYEMNPSALEHCYTTSCALPDPFHLPDL